MLKTGILNETARKRRTFQTGGTSLLKWYGLIKRFSEDIDLVVLRRGSESNNKLTNKIKAISEIVSKVLREVALPGVTIKMGMNP